jgi:hypothetical protein
VLVSHFLGRGSFSPSICLGPCKLHFSVPCTWSPWANGICKDAKTFQGWFLCSYPILVLRNRDPCWCPRAKSPTSFKEGGRSDPDAQKGATLGFVFLLLSPFFLLALCWVCLQKMYFV